MTSSFLFSIKYCCRCGSLSSSYLSRKILRFLAPFSLLRVPSFLHCRVVGCASHVHVVRVAPRATSPPALTRPRSARRYYAPVGVVSAAASLHHSCSVGYMVPSSGLKPLRPLFRSRSESRSLLHFAALLALTIPAAYYLYRWLLQLLLSLPLHQHVSGAQLTTRSYYLSLLLVLRELELSLTTAGSAPARARVTVTSSARPPYYSWSSCWWTASHSYACACARAHAHSHARSCSRSRSRSLLLLSSALTKLALAREPTHYSFA